MCASPQQPEEDGGHSVRVVQQHEALRQAKGRRQGAFAKWRRKKATHVTNVRGRASRLGQEANQPQSTSRQHIKQGADLADGRQVGACHPLVQPNHQAQHLHKIMFTMQQQSVSQSMSRRGTGFGMKNQTFAL